MSEATSAPFISRREAILGAAMMGTALISWAAKPRRNVVAVASGDLNQFIPDRVGNWRLSPVGELVQPPADEQNAAAVYEDQVLRTYSDNINPEIMFVLAYDRNQSGMLMVHRPESCYPGSGFTITADQAVDILLAPGLTPHGRFLSTERDVRIEQVLYWTRLGNEFPRTWHEERCSLALQNLRGIAPDGALVRLSCIDADADGARVRLSHFAAALFAASGRNGRALLGGPAIDSNRVA